MTFSVTDVRIASRLVERGKDKTVRNSTNLQLPVGIVIAKLLNCIPSFRIVYINTTPSCLWYDNARPNGNLGSARKTAGPSP